MCLLTRRFLGPTQTYPTVISEQGPVICICKCSPGRVEAMHLESGEWLSTGE